MSTTPDTYQDGRPTAWDQAVSSTLAPAIWAVVEEGAGRGAASPEQLELTRWYCQYYVDAPCFNETPGIAELRTIIRQVTTFDALEAWLGYARVVEIIPI